MKRYISLFFSFRKCSLSTVYCNRQWHPGQWCAVRRHLGQSSAAVVITHFLVLAHFGYENYHTNEEWCLLGCYAVWLL
jgi:hypothetical protein